MNNDRSNKFKKNYHSKVRKVCWHWHKGASEEASASRCQGGEIFGVIGPMEQKTTLFRMRLLLPDSGSARLDKYDVIDDYKEIRKIIGYMPGRFSLYGFECGGEFDVLPDLTLLFRKLRVY